MVKLYNDDCRNMLSFIEPSSVDLTVTSPPYDNLRTYNNSLDWNFTVFKDVARILYDVTAYGGVVVWIVNDATINFSETGTSFSQALYFKKTGFNLHDTMIWKKATATDTGSLRFRYGGNFEFMFVFSKGRIKTFNPIKDRKNNQSVENPNGLAIQHNFQSLLYMTISFRGQILETQFSIHLWGLGVRGLPA